MARSSRPCSSPRRVVGKNLPCECPATIVISHFLLCEEIPRAGLRQAGKCESSHAARRDRGREQGCANGASESCRHSLPSDAPRSGVWSDSAGISSRPVSSSIGFTPLSDTLPEIHISKQRLKRFEAVRLVREQRETGRQQLAFHARPFVLCSLPLRRPPRDQTSHTRRNGKFFLQVIGHPQFGLPYGQDRLILIYAS